jgi:hypothetical protein
MTASNVKGHSRLMMPATDHDTARKLLHLHRHPARHDIQARLRG